MKRFFPESADARATAADRLGRFVKQNQIGVLNVSGPRVSMNPLCQSLLPLYGLKHDQTP